MGRGEQKTVACRRCIWANGQYIAFEAENFELADLSSQNQAFHSCSYDCFSYRALY